MLHVKNRGFFQAAYHLNRKRRLSDEIQRTHRGEQVFVYGRNALEIQRRLAV